MTDRYTLEDVMYWKPRALAFAHKLQKRIDDMKGKFYNGCGFHYAMVADIAKTIEYIEGMSETDDIAYPIVYHVRLEMLTEEVVKAEASLKKELDNKKA